MNGRTAAAALGAGCAVALALAGCVGPGSASGGPATSAGLVAPASGAGPAAARRATASGGGTTAPGRGTAGKNAAAASDVITFPPGGAAAVAAWYHGRGGAEFTSLTRALDHATRASASGGLAAFARSCAAIRSAARGAQNAPPMPLAAVARVYESALAIYVTSAAKCEHASAAGDSASLRDAIGAVQANGTTLNHAAAVLIAALGGK